MFTPITPITITGAVLAATLACSAFVLPVASVSAPAPVATTANAPAPSADELEFMKRFEGRAVATPKGICGTTESWLSLQALSEQCDVDVVWQSNGASFEVEMLDATGKTQPLKPVSAALKQAPASVVDVAEKPAAKTSEVKPVVTAQPALSAPQKPAVLTQAVGPQKQQQVPSVPEVTLPPAAGTPDSSGDAVTEEDSSEVPAVSETLLLNGGRFTFEGEGDFRQLVGHPRKGVPTPDPILGSTSVTRVVYGWALKWEDDTFVSAVKLQNPWVTPIEAEESVYLNGGGLEVIFRGQELESRPTVHPMPEGDLTVGTSVFTEVVRGWSFTFTNGLLTDYRFVGYKHPSA